MMPIAAINGERRSRAEYGTPRIFKSELKKAGYPAPLAYIGGLRNICSFRTKNISGAIFASSVVALNGRYTPMAIL
jgi:hypothetical protein